MGLELLVTAIIGVVGGGAGTALVVGWFNRKKTTAESESLKAEATKVIRDAASDMVRDYREDNKDLRDRLDEMERKLATTEQKLHVTQRQLETATYAFAEAVKLLKETGADVSRLIKYIDAQEQSD